MSNEIDFAIPWVDGADPAWRKKFHKYKGTQVSVGADCREERYRDWGILHYWFRAVETYAPWVHKVHFITWGHVPEWLDTSHPKINIVRHDEYIPDKYLPTFNANPIELNMHRIEGLTEQFVYFNDDMFLTKPIHKSDFFRKGLPCDMAVLGAISGNGIYNIVMNDISLINKSHNKKTVIKRHFFKWFNCKYRFKLIRNFLLLPWPRFTGFYDNHQPQPFLKSTFNEVWEKFGQELDQTSSTKFRSPSDYNQYLFRYWQLVTGTFYPNCRKEKNFSCSNGELSEIKRVFVSRNTHTVCLNDVPESSTDFEGTKKKLQVILEETFPDKSQYEKYKCIHCCPVKK